MDFEHSRWVQVVKVMSLCFQIEFPFRLYKEFFHRDRYYSRGVIKNEVCCLRSSVGTIADSGCHVGRTGSRRGTPTNKWGPKTRPNKISIESSLRHGSVWDSNTNVSLNSFPKINTFGSPEPFVFKTLKGSKHYQNRNLKRSEIGFLRFWSVLGGTET